VATAWDQAVDELGELHELDGGLVGGVLDEDDAVLGQTRLLQRLAHHARDRDVRAQRRARPSQQRGVAGLQAEAGGIARHVRPVLVDDRHDAQRHPDLSDLEAVGPHPSVEQLADRVGQRGDLAQPVGHAGDAPVGEAQTVERARLHAACGGALGVAGVGGEDLGRPLDEQVGRGEQGGVLLGRRRRRQPP
jgi:hypothetical protein